MLRMTLEVATLDEPNLGPKWQAQFSRAWPAYRRWFLSHGEAARPTYRQSYRALQHHMPEFVPIYEQMTDLAGCGDFSARFLGQYCPPPFFAACSQVMLIDDEPVLIRNYDYSPLLHDGLIMKTSWGGRDVIAVTDCMSGVLDGMNADGLAISLTFGGRRVVGEGFGITLVQRYILEACRTVDEARAVLRRVPVQAAYNVAVLDSHGDHAMFMLSPDRAPIETRRQAATNHQDGDRWEKYTAMIQSDERFDYLSNSLADKRLTAEDYINLFRREPLARDSYALGYGTLYTAAYFPRRGEIRCYWPDNSWTGRFDQFSEVRFTTTFGDPDAREEDGPVWPPAFHGLASVPQGFIAH